MTYLCRRWWDSYTTPDNGDTIDSFYANNDCSLGRDATAYIDSDGEVGEYVAGDGDVWCDQHDDNNVRWCEGQDELIARILRDIDEQTDYHTCEECADGWNTLLFTSEDTYNEHRQLDHQDEPTDAGPTGPTLRPTAPPAITHIDHPDLLSWQRDLVGRWLRSPEPAAFHNYTALLIPRTSGYHRIQVVNTDLTSANIRSIAGHWTAHFIAIRDDPHFLQGRSSHAAWS